MEAIGLGDADEVITRGLDEASLGSWWDLANLIAAYYHALDVFVHVPAGAPATSMPMAIARLGEALANAEAESPGGSAIYVVSEDAGAASPELLRALERVDPGIPLEVVHPGPADAVVSQILDRVAGPVSPSQSREEVRHA
jgi:hypothetical protein